MQQNLQSLSDNPQNPPPHGRHRTVQGQPPQGPAQDHPHTMKGPEQASGRVKGKQHHAQQQTQAKDQVCQPHQPSAAQRPQQIIQQAQQQPKGRCLQKLQSLSSCGKLHQPKSRAKKPPASRLSSS